MLSKAEAGIRVTSAEIRSGVTSTSSTILWYALRHAAELLSMFVNMRSLNVAAAAAKQTVELCLAVPRFVSRVVMHEKTQQQQQQSDGVDTDAPLHTVLALASASCVLQLVLLDVEYETMGPACTELVQAPCFLPGVCLMIAHMGYSLLLKSHGGSLPGLVAGSSSRGSSQHRTQTIQDLDAQAMVELLDPASAQEGRTTWQSTCQQASRLPASHKLLFQLLGVDDPRMVLWPAHHLKSVSAEGFSRAVSILSVVGSAQPSGNMQQQQQLLAAVCCYLTYYNTHSTICSFSCTIMHHTGAACCKLLKPAVQDFQQRESGSSGSSSSSGGSQQQPHMTTMLVVEEAMALLPTVLSRLHLAIDAGSSGGSSSSSSSSSSRNTGNAATMHTMEMLLASLIDASCTVKYVALDKPAAAVWARHAAQLIPQFEAYLRFAVGATAAAVIPPLSLAAAAARPAERTEDLDGAQKARVATATLLSSLLIPEPASQRPGPLLVAVVSAGRYSEQRQHLLGLLCSLLKLHAVVRLPHIPPDLKWSVCNAFLFGAVTRSAVALVIEAAASAPERGGPAFSPQQALPWLNIFGRCCLQLAEQLPMHPAPDALTSRQPQIVSAARMLHKYQRYACVLKQIQAAFLAYLLQAGVSDGLRAAGYNMEPVLDQFAAAVAALEAVWEGEADDTKQLQSHLHALCAALCAASPVAKLCNNPVCSNITGPTEAQLVSRRSCTCSGCLTARYCNRDSCQRPHWKAHKPVCQALAAATAAAGGSVSSS